MSNIVATAKDLGNQAVQVAGFALLRLGAPDINGSNQFSSIAVNGTYQPDTADGVSKLNTPVYGKIILGVDGGVNNFVDAQGKSGSYRTLELDCAVVDVSFNNTVIVTPIQGLPTTIKEFISSGDSDITITGIFTSVVGVAPIDFIQNLNQIFSAPVPIPVTNYLLNSLDIYNIVIMPGTNLPQEQAGYAYQKFTIKAISDIPMTELLP